MMQVKDIFWHMAFVTRPVDENANFISISFYKYELLLNVSKSLLDTGDLMKE